MKHLYAQTIVLFVCSSFPNLSALAQTATNTTLAIQRAAARLDEINDLIHSKRTSVRQAALQAALKDPSAIIKDVAISGYLTRFKTMTPEIVIETGSPIGPEDAPQLVTKDIHWDENGTEFSGALDGLCFNLRGVSGELAGGKLSVHFDGVCLSTTYRGLENSDKKRNPLVSTPCDLILLPNDSGDELEGALRCMGVALSPKVRLAFGA